MTPAATLVTIAVFDLGNDETRYERNGKERKKKTSKEKWEQNLVKISVNIIKVSIKPAFWVMDLWC